MDFIENALAIVSGLTTEQMLCVIVLAGFALAAYAIHASRSRNE